MLPFILLDGKLPEAPSPLFLFPACFLAECGEHLKFRRRPGICKPPPALLFVNRWPAMSIAWLAMASLELSAAPRALSTHDKRPVQAAAHPLRHTGRQYIQAGDKP
jgi:hypothetical protein